ncbi:hypothetical protein KBX73_10145 [Acetobacter persici]|uniref:hypothetical protein n=1 Tax=Acetobacter persici TaxID=1076596 RepID=UPI0020CF0759|nr:hypothetical protein [Acetobacter persici]MCP9320125.1 hypothetical protein [Acetobacter persici]
MTRKAVISIDYGHYAMSMKDAMTIMQISERAVKVERVPGQYDRYAASSEGRSFADSMEMAEVESAPKAKVIPKSHRITHEKS